MESLTLDVSDLTPSQVAQLLEFARQLSTEGGGESPGGDEVDDEAWRTAPSTGWTLKHVELLREHLKSRGKTVQLNAFDQAIARGGFISRDSVYRIGGYDPARRLNNWTAPFTVASNYLEDEHGLPSTADWPIETEYGDGGPQYRPAIGFRVTAEIVKLVREAAETV